MERALIRFMPFVAAWWMWARYRVDRPGTALARGPAGWTVTVFIEHKRGCGEV
jgi:hypothetical protein